MLYNFATARAAAIKAGTIIVAEGYMDVIALVRAGFDACRGAARHRAHRRPAAAAVAHRARTDPGLRRRRRRAEAAHRAAHLALPHLKAGLFAALCLPAGGRRSRQLHRAPTAPAAMRELLDDGAAAVASAVAGRNRGQGFLHARTPRRAGTRAGARSSPRSPTARSPTITAATSSSRCSRPSSAARRPPSRRAGAAIATGRFRAAAAMSRPGFRPMPARETVSPAVKASLLARSGQTGARQRQGDANWPPCCSRTPSSPTRHGELLAELPFPDPSLDRLRHELLNLAASGSSLEKPGLRTISSVREWPNLLPVWARAAGEPADARQRRRCRGYRGPVPRAPPAICARWRNASRNGHRAMERLKSEATEESWHEAQRLLGLPERMRRQPPK